MRGVDLCRSFASAHGARDTQRLEGEVKAPTEARHPQSRSTEATASTNTNQPAEVSGRDKSGFGAIQHAMNPEEGAKPEPLARLPTPEQVS